MQPGITGEPLKAPASYFSSASAAMILPARLAPSLMRMRLAASVWQHLDRNPWMKLTTTTAVQILGMDRPPLPVPGSPGPFSLADPDATAALLAGAGFVEVELESVETPFLLEGDGTAAAERVLSAGPLGPSFLAADDAKRRDVVAGVVDALSRHRSADGFLVPAASWCVTAQRP